MNQSRFRELLRMGCPAHALHHAAVLNGGKGDSPPPPDYTPLAQASAEAARIGAELGREQLAEARRQYDQNVTFAKPVLDAQMRLMRQAEEQGNEYFDYWKRRAQPVEDALNADAMQEGSAQRQEEAAAQAVADARRGYTSAINAAIRQGLRYGWSPAALAARAASTGREQAQAEAAAANSGRERAKQLGWAKKLDVAGLYRGMPGASQGAYGLMLNSGNSAMQNQMAPGQQYLQGMQAGNSTIMQGQGMRQQGLSSILNTQAGLYGQGLQASAQEGAGLASGLGTVAGAALTVF